ncbi:hypothetical protein FH972_025617 [Carpinus fangiana]|uniref:Uncharacterized protein n=1 Tax=Carpinus fangiana TaxID=176857 RepID=A0A5N6L1I8_9ROSI|nr:hypothetical protein FH972_025617 [Carpinus fangiana]
MAASSLLSLISVFCLLLASSSASIALKPETTTITIPLSPFFSKHPFSDPIKTLNSLASASLTRARHLKRSKPSSPLTKTQAFSLTAMEATLSPSASANPHKPHLSFWTLAVALSGSLAPLAISAPIAPFPTLTPKKSQLSFQSYHLLRRFWVAKTPNVPGFLAQMCSLVAKIAADLPKTARRLALRT